jgi:hypothetical protein
MWGCASSRLTSRLARGTQTRGVRESAMRKRVLACVIGVAGALWLVPSAAADTATIGAPAPSSDALGGTCTEPCAFLQASTDAVSPSYVVPPLPAGGSPWSVTSWSALGGSGDSSASLEIWRPTATAGELRLIAIGPEQPFPTNVVTSHPVSIPVLPGDHLGILAGSDANFSPQYGTPYVGDVWIGPHPSPAVGQTTGAPSSDFFPTYSGTNVRINVAAVLTSAPAVAIPTPTTKKCKKKKHKRSAQSAKKKKCKKHKK